MIDARPERTAAELDEAQLDGLARQLVDDSWAVVPGAYAGAKVDRLRGALAELYDRLEAPPLWSQRPLQLSDDLEVSGTGLVIHRLLSFAPELHRDLLEPPIVAILRRALGDDMHLEFAGAVITDASRPFFKWHNHVGGIDDERYRRLGLRPPVESIERVAMIVYLDAMGPDTGQLLIHPRRVSGRAGPPGDIDSPRWDDQVAVVGPPGTVVMIDQTTWHAALPRARPGLRFFFGLWFAAARAPRAARVDASLDAIDSPDPLLRSLLATRPR
ncbi:MAG: hypothetical protein R3A79_20260 [Nannocystaceae bacterium]